MTERVHAGVQLAQAPGAYAVADRIGAQAEPEQVGAPQQRPLPLGAFDDRCLQGVVQQVAHMTT